MKFPKRCPKCKSNKLMMSQTVMRNRFRELELACICEESESVVAAKETVIRLEKWACDLVPNEFQDRSADDYGLEEVVDSVMTTLVVWCEKCVAKATAWNWTVNEDELSNIDFDTNNVERFIYCDSGTDCEWSMPIDRLI